MNTLVIVLIAAVCLFGAYTLYGRWLANKWGIDPTAKTPAVVHEPGNFHDTTNGIIPYRFNIIKSISNTAAMFLNGTVKVRAKPIKSGLLRSRRIRR